MSGMRGWSGPLLALACGVALVSTAACTGSSEPRTPEEAKARGLTLLREMSDTLGKAQAFSFETAEAHTRLKRNGQKVNFEMRQEIALQRPNHFATHITGGDDRDFLATYDGHAVTLVGNKMKVYASFDAPATIDQTLDLIDQRYDLPMPVADFLYSSPYDSFADPTAKGGWAKRELVGDKSCDELSYQLESLDINLWIAADAPKVPCQIELTYKAKPGKPTSRLTFSNWNLTATPPAAQFTANVPAGYEKIPIIERIPKTELKADASKAMGVTPPPAPAPAPKH